MTENWTFEQWHSVQLQQPHKNQILPSPKDLGATNCNNDNACVLGEMVLTYWGQNIIAIMCRGISKFIL